MKISLEEVAFHYTIPESISFSYFGLREKLRSQYGEIFKDLETFFVFKFKDFKDNSCEKDNCFNSFYFSHDGHLNSRSHKLLFEYLYKDMIFN